MCELKYTEDDIKQAIQELVPAYNTKIVLSSIDLAPPELEELGLKLTGEFRNQSLVINSGSRAGPERSLWDCIKKEVFDFLCTKSQKYRADRAKGETNVKSLLTILSTAIASQFNLTVGVVAGAVTVAIISVLKIGTNAWCEKYSSK